MNDDYKNKPCKSYVSKAHLCDDDDDDNSV
jgi:hypothetical protein